MNDKHIIMTNIKTIEQVSECVSLASNELIHPWYNVFDTYVIFSHMFFTVIEDCIQPNGKLFHIKWLRAFFSYLTGDEKILPDILSVMIELPYAFLYGMSNIGGWITLVVHMIVLCIITFLILLIINKIILKIDNQLNNADTNMLENINKFSVKTYFIAKYVSYVLLGVLGIWAVYEMIYVVCHLMPVGYIGVGIVCIIGIYPVVVILSAIFTIIKYSYVYYLIYYPLYYPLYGLYYFFFQLNITLGYSYGTFMILIAMPIILCLLVLLYVLVMYCLPKIRKIL